MKIKLIISALLLVSAIPMHSSLTEKLAANAKKIATIKQEIKSGKFITKDSCRKGCTKCGKDSCGGQY